MERQSRIEINVVKETNRTLEGLVCFAGIALALAIGAAKGTEYEIIKLAPLDPNCNYSYASSINSCGVVVGVYGEKAPRNFTVWEKPFLYKDGIFRAIDIKLDNYPYDVINDFGEILGRSPDPNLSHYSAIYKIDRVIVLDFWGSDINNKGEVCGDYTNNYPCWRDAAGNIIRLTTGSGYGANTHAINDNSQITGNTGFSPYDMACIWENGEIRYLEQLGTHTQGLDINNKGEVAGHGGSRACWWDAEGDIHIINSGGDKAYALNHHGTIVGGDPAYIYEKGEIKYLRGFLPDNSGWETLKRALDINNEGQIVGYGDYNEGGVIHSYAFLMNPIQKVKTLQTDSNDDGIVNGKDLAELANQWLEKEDWYEE